MRPKVLVDIADEQELELPVSTAEIEASAVAALARAGAERDVSVSVSLVAPERIRALNAEWRGIDTPTDVLSFECDSPFDEDIPAGELVELGDVVLCPEVIAEQAPRFSGTFESEFRIMLVHGLFHLLGYDHVDEEGALEMEAVEMDVLRDLAIVRGDDPDAIVLGPTTRHVDD